MPNREKLPSDAAAKRGPQRDDARRDPGKQRKNQERLGVGPEHKTEAMKKGHRGTFP